MRRQMRGVLAKSWEEALSGCHLGPQHRLRWERGWLGLALGALRLGR